MRCDIDGIARIKNMAQSPRIGGLSSLSCGVVAALDFD